MRRKLQRANGWKLLVFTLATGLLVVVVFWIRAYQTSSADAKICRKVDKLDVGFFKFISNSKPPKPGDYGYTYWLVFHKREPNGAPGGKPPPALIALFRSAACDPDNLPSQGSKP